MTADTDRDALLALHQSTCGEGWTNQRNWGSQAAIDEWHGVKTDAAGRVVEIDLRGNNLEGPIPEEIGQLTELRRLRLNRNRLTGEIPRQIGSLGNLTQLGLGGNRLSGRLPAEIGSLGRLERMGLANNDLEGPVPAEFGDLTSLRALFMGSNASLEGPLPASFGNLTNLADLFIDNNRMKGALPSALTRLTKMERFWFSETELFAPADAGFQAWLDGIGEVRRSNAKPQPQDNPKPQPEEKRLESNVGNEFFDRLEGEWKNQIDGRWLDDLGWNFISQPKLGHPGPDDFEMRHDQMRETIVFRKLGGLARNVGVTGAAGFWAAMAYEVSIETPQGEGIHHEMGHFLLKVNDTGEAHRPFGSTIIRQATIPRANAMMTLGTLKPGAIDRGDKAYDARPRSQDAALQTSIDDEFAKRQSAIVAAGGPDIASPLAWLGSKFPNRSSAGFPDWVFEFRNDANPSQMANGQRVSNPVGIGNLLSDFWIGSRTVDGRSVLVLQYAQVVDLLFNGMEWPHVAVNTLIKQ